MQQISPISKTQEILRNARRKKTCVIIQISVSLFACYAWVYQLFINILALNDEAAVIRGCIPDFGVENGTCKTLNIFDFHGDFCFCNFDGCNDEFFGENSGITLVLPTILTYIFSAFFCLSW